MDVILKSKVVVLCLLQHIHVHHCHSVHDESQFKGWESHW